MSTKSDVCLDTRRNVAGLKSSEVNVCMLAGTVQLKFTPPYENIFFPKEEIVGGVAAGVVSTSGF